MRATVAILNRVVTLLQAAQWTPDGGVPEAAFGEVAKFDSTDLAAAFRTLLMSGQRVAVVVYAGGQWEDASSQTQVVARRTLDVSVLVSDRVHGDRQAAIFGSGTTPGALALKDLAVTTLTGRLLDNPDGVNCQPDTEDLLTIESTEKQQPGRVAALVEFFVVGGITRSTPSSGPIS